MRERLGVLRFIILISSNLLGCLNKCEAYVNKMECCCAELLVARGSFCHFAQVMNLLCKGFKYH